MNVPQPLRTKTLQAFVEDDGETICIVEDHAQTDQEDNEYVWISIEDAAALRDWLNELLHSSSAAQDTSAVTCGRGKAQRHCACNAS